MVMIETKRLLLRSYQPEDIPEQHRILFSDANVMKYLYAQRPYTYEETDLLIRRFMLHEIEHGFAPWVMLDKATGEMIGFAGLVCVNWSGNCGDAQITGAVAKTHQRSGYAFEAMGAAFHYGFDHLGLERVIGIAYSANDGLWKLAEKMVDFEMQPPETNPDGSPRPWAIITPTTLNLADFPYTLKEAQA